MSRRIKRESIKKLLVTSACCQRFKQKLKYIVKKNQRITRKKLIINPKWTLVMENTEIEQDLAS